MDAGDQEGWARRYSAEGAREGWSFWILQQPMNAAYPPLIELVRCNRPWEISHTFSPVVGGITSVDEICGSATRPEPIKYAPEQPGIVREGPGPDYRVPQRRFGSQLYPLRPLGCTNEFPTAAANYICKSRYAGEDNRVLDTLDWALDSYTEGVPVKYC